MPVLTFGRCKQLTFSDFFDRSSWWRDFGQQTWKTGLHDAIWYKNTVDDVLNGWDDELEYGWSDCNEASAITGIGGVHDNHREDRRWWVKVSPVVGQIVQGQCQWTDFINDWDGSMNHQISSNQFISRIFSYHDSHHEDRRWRLCLCTVS